MTAPLRGITLTHPWAVCISDLAKDVENRSWHPRKWGGRVGMYLAIHGGKPPAKLDGTSQKALDLQGDLNWVARNIVNAGHLPDSMTDEQFQLYTEKLAGLDVLNLSTFVRPGIVAVCRLRGVVADSRSPWAVRGQYRWQLEQVLPIEPIAYTGGLGLWEIDAHSTDRLRACWAAAHDGEVVF